MEAVDERHGDDRPGRLRRVGDSPRAARRRWRPASRRSTCLPAASAAQRQRLVQVVRRADVHDVDVVGLDGVLGRVEGPLGAELGGGRCAGIGGRRRDADQAGAGQPGRPGVDPADEAGAGHGDTQAARHARVDGGRAFGGDRVPLLHGCDLDDRLMSAVNQKSDDSLPQAARNLIFDTRKPRWFTTRRARRPSVTPVTGEGAGAILHLVRSGQADTRAELAGSPARPARPWRNGSTPCWPASCWSSSGDGRSTGGRPPTRLAFNRDAGVVLCGDLGATHCRDRRDRPRRRGARPRPGETSPSPTDPTPSSTGSRSAFVDLVAETGRDLASVRGVGVGLPGPVEFATGRPVSPPIMPGWDRYPVGERLAMRFGTPRWSTTT